MLKHPMSGTVEGLRPGQVLEGPSLPGPTGVVTVMPTGDLLRLVGKGLESGQFVDLYLSAEQLAGLHVLGGEVDLERFCRVARSAAENLTHRDTNHFAPVAWTSSTLPSPSMRGIWSAYPPPDGSCPITPRPRRSRR